jgi:hypothetical protein
MDLVDMGKEKKRHYFQNNHSIEGLRLGSDDKVPA